MEQPKLNRHEMRRAAFLLTFEREFFPDQPVEEMFARPLRRDALWEESNIDLS